jgi:hypothetical protein
MKRNFVVGLFGGLIGSAMLLILLSAAGVVGARAIQSQPEAARTQEVSAATPLTSTFTYQGQLKNNGSPVNNPACQMAFRLYDDPSSSTNLIGIPFTTTVPVTNGLFTVGLNFGNSAFNGDGRWLDIQVNCGSGFVTLTPRQALTPAPYAFALPGLYTQQDAISPNIIGGYSGNWVTSGVHGATIGGGGGSVDINRVTDNFGVVGGGHANQAGDNTGLTWDKLSATVGGGFYNTASGSDSTVGGGTLNTASGNSAAVGGGDSNIASGAGSFVGGGGYDGNSTFGNQAVGNVSTIGGGLHNTASNWDATVGGGDTNNASGDHATIGGGGYNSASDWYATVSGGDRNNASGDHATVPGGYHATASHYGEMAYASGQFAANGDAQTSVYVLRNTTTNTTTTELFLDGSSQRITLPVSRTATFDILITGLSSTGLSAGYQVLGVIANIGGTTVLVNPVMKTVIAEDVPAWDVFVQANNTNDALVIFVTGSASTTIRWVATVRTVEVSY